MIAYVSGILADKGTDHIVVEAEGIGYYLTVSDLLLSKLPPIGSSVKIYSYLALRDDGLYLYGFLSNEEKSFFTSLIATQGIGPKTAISIMSKIEPNEFISAVCFEDIKTLSSLPGIGKKTAQRLILELKDKFIALDNPLVLNSDHLNSTSSNNGFSIIKEVSSALEALGYRPAEYGQILKEASKDLEKTALLEDYLKYVLSRLGS